MNTLILDNGKEFHSTHLTEACAQLGVDLTFCPGYTPHYKGAVERVFRTLNTKLLHTLPGTTFSNPTERGNYNAEKNACLTYDELHELIVNFFGCEYPNAFHTGIHKTPLQAWEQGVRKHPVRPIGSLQDLGILTAYTDTRQLTRKGIETFGLFYNAPELEALRRTRTGPIRRSVSVKIKYDPGDIGHIYVADPDGHAYVRADCTTDYARGLTLWQHNYIKREARDGLKPGDTADIDLLIRVRDRCFALVQNAGKRITRRAKKTFGQDNRAEPPLLPAPDAEPDTIDEIRAWLSDSDTQDDLADSWSIDGGDRQNGE